MPSVLCDYRSWGTKLVYWIQDLANDDSAAQFLDYKYGSIAAGLMQALCVVLLLCGLSLGKMLVNGVTLIKLSLILFMTIAALTAFKSENLDPFVPPEYGVGGVLTGGTAAFFGFIGFDEVGNCHRLCHASAHHRPQVCCMAGEAKNPAKTMPRAVVGTVVGTAVISILASLGLVGMISYTAIDSDAGFASGFAQHYDAALIANDSARVPLVELERDCPHYTSWRGNHTYYISLYYLFIYAD